MACRVERYARAVCTGAAIAGPHVRNECARFLRDLETCAARGVFFDAHGAAEAIAFYEEVLRLNGGEFEGVPYKLLDWQAFIVGSLFGWKRTDGRRRFRVAYIETGKGSGKSPLAAGIGLYGLTADGEERAEIYAAATKKDQAQILFRDAVAMVDQSEELNFRISRSGSRGKEWNLAYHPTNSFFRPIASDEGQSGPRPHIALLDEIHEHRDGSVVEMMRAGTKGRRQALIVMITNSGSDKRSVCYEYHEYGAQVAAGTVEDDSFFSYICALDAEDDPFRDEGCWPKANPSLGVTIKPEYLREQVTQARGMPGKEAVVRRLNFCQWTESASPWISSVVWFGAKRTEIDDEFEERLRGRRCWGGLDLSSVKDLTAFALVFEPTPQDPKWFLRVWHWTPAVGIAQKSEEDRVPYATWAAHGHLRTTPGTAISKLHVLGDLVNLCERYDVQDIAYDRWRIEDLKSLMQQEGLELPPLESFGQGYQSMGPAVDEFDRRLLNDEFEHDGNPVLTWCAANAVTTSNPAGDRKLDKERAHGRIDGIVASVMAVARSSVQAVPEVSVYEIRGLRRL